MGFNIAVMTEKINLDPQLISKVTAEINALSKDKREALQQKLGVLEDALDKKSLLSTRNEFNSLQLILQ